jgi:sterol desaturase/sphingolipid hydroxylase (fatty acid hydroxylase superfamily)
MILAFVLGAIAWTLAEYALHRGLGHRRGAKNAFSVEHLRHHATVTYFAPATKKVIAALLVLGAIAPPLGVAFEAEGIAGALGFVTMYATYEVIHRRLHTHAGTTRYGRWARRHHFHHHFSRPRMNHGVTTPIWDWVFGTLEVPERVQVPPKNALPWMLDDRGRLLEELHADYRLGRA